MLCNYAGLLQTDGYIGYTSWLNDKKHKTEKAAITHVACRAHARRKFVESPGHPVAQDIVKLSAKLYRIETKLRKTPDLDRAVYRKEHATVHLEHSPLEIDNNLVENAIRPIAIGKKNFLFFGSPDSGQTSAILYSLIETCRKLDLNPAEYLRELLEVLPNMKQDEITDWTPSRWKSIRETTNE